MSDKLVKKIKNEIVLVSMKKVNVSKKLMQEKQHNLSMPLETFPGFEESQDWEDWRLEPSFQGMDEITFSKQKPKRYNNNRHTAKRKRKGPDFSGKKLPEVLSFNIIRSGRNDPAIREFNASKTEKKPHSLISAESRNMQIYEAYNSRSQK